MKFNTTYKCKKFNERPVGAVVDTLVIHHTSMINAQSAISLLCDEMSDVSCHYLIDKSGIVYKLVDDSKKALHAGESYWREKYKINDFSIGIELDNNGFESFSDHQIESLVNLSQYLMDRYPIEQRNIVAHADVASNRKTDPNQNFNWEKLAEYNIGLYPKIKIENPDILFKTGVSVPEIKMLKEKLSDYGYLIKNINEKFDLELLNVIHAFKRHFCPETYSYTHWDTLAEAKLNKLLEMIKSK